MYIPAAFAEPDRTKLHDFIEQNSFGLLVSQVDGLPFATHLPFFLERTAGPHGCLIGHMARANPQWEQAVGQTALAIFSGPHAYISPTWYEAVQVVPTWNYAAVHAYGRVRIIEDESALLVIVQKSVRIYEQAMPRPWSLGNIGLYMERLLGQIVGFRIEIEKIEGKWKLNQNHPVERPCWPWPSAVPAVDAHDLAARSGLFPLSPNATQGICSLSGLRDFIGNRIAMTYSLCETCASMREIITPKGSRFLLCQLSHCDLAFPKYPPQPVVRCDGYQTRDKNEEQLQQ